jgi:hypothetical protein
VNTSGTVTNYCLPSSSYPQAITGGSDSALWFTNAGDSSIRRITTDTAPGALALKPASVAAAPSGSDVKLTWPAPANNAACPTTSYTVRYWQGGTLQGVWAYTSDRTLTVSGLTVGQSYQFTVSATNNLGEGPQSPKSAAVIMGSPSAPVKPTVAKGAAGSLEVTFKKPANNGATIRKYTATCTRRTAAEPVRRRRPRLQ